MKALSYNQRNGGHRKALCPGAPQGPTWYHADLMIILMMQKRMTGWGRGKKGKKTKAWKESLTSDRWAVAGVGSECSAPLDGSPALLLHAALCEGATVNALKGLRKTIGAGWTQCSEAAWAGPPHSAFELMGFRI